MVHHDPADTHAATEKYFQDNEFFGLDSVDVMFFQQGSLPCFTPEGKIIMQSKHEMATAPDGNGGIYVPCTRVAGLTTWQREGSGTCTPTASTTP